MSYNYKQAVLDDVLEVIPEYFDRERFSNRKEFESYLNDELWIDDSVTGNGSGSYTFNSHKAEEYLSGNWDLMREVIQEFGLPKNLDELNPEYIDVSIRCYLLGECISEALDEMEEELFPEDDEDVRYLTRELED